MAFALRRQCWSSARFVYNEAPILRKLFQPYGCSLQNRAVARSHSTSITTDPPAIYTTTSERTPGNKVATITVSNPAKLNIVNTPMLLQLVATCQGLSTDDALQAVVLTGAPTAVGKQDSFIGGADIKEMHSISSSNDARAFITRVHSACQALRDLPVPCLARVSGFALGAGLEIMAACDLRIATEQSVFAMPEVRVGIPSVVEAAILPSLIGMGRTRRLLYLAETIGATEAERWGLVEKVVHDEAALDEGVNDWIDKLTAMGPKAIRSQKKLMLQWEDSSIQAGVHAGIDAFADAYADGGIEPKQYMDQFLERKRWT